MDKLFLVIWLLFFHNTLLAQIDSISYDNIDKFKITDSLERIKFLTLLKVYSSKQGYITEESQYSNLYDISKNNNKSVLALIGCFHSEYPACKFGYTLRIYKRVGEKYKLLFNSNSYFSLYYVKKATNSNDKFKPVIGIKLLQSGVYCYERLRCFRREEETKLIAFREKKTIPYTVVKSMAEYLDLSLGDGIRYTLENIELKDIKLFDDKKILITEYFGYSFKFQCDLEGINCKQIKD